jgi:ribosomal protein S18 acetylase RimI-like enzyme
MALIYHPYLLLFVIFRQLISSTLAFSSSPSNVNNQSSTLPHKNYKQVKISKVQTNNDILSLAKLRYQEWMINESNPPLLSNFCKATSEIYNERKIDGSIVFLAKLVHQSNDDDLVVGAAELSSIGLQNCIINNSDNTNDVDIAAPLYITDVVTSSTHRRFGIGTKLMSEVERVALYELNTRIVFLHVENDNLAARKFYGRLGYIDVVVGGEDCKERGDTIEVISISFDEPSQQSVVTAEDGWQHDAIIILDTKQLAINAGTVGQLLMMKRLSKESIPKVVDGDDISSQSPPSIKPATSKGGGFGKQQQVKQSRNKKKRKK